MVFAESWQSRLVLLWMSSWWPGGRLFAMLASLSYTVFLYNRLRKKCCFYMSNLSGSSQWHGSSLIVCVITSSNTMLQQYFRLNLNAVKCCWTNYVFKLNLNQKWCIFIHFGFWINGWNIIFTGRPAQSAAMPVLFLLSRPKIGFFAPRGQHVGPINAKFVTFPRAKFHVYRGRNVGIQLPKLSKFLILAINICHPPCQMSRLSGQKCGNTAPKTVKISNFGRKFAP